MGVGKKKNLSKKGRKEENQQQNQLKHHIVSVIQNMKPHLVGMSASTTTPLLFPTAYMSVNTQYLTK